MFDRLNLHQLPIKNFLPPEIKSLCSAKKMVVQLWYEERIRDIEQLWLYNCILPIASSFPLMSLTPSTKTPRQIITLWLPLWLSQDTIFKDFSKTHSNQICKDKHQLQSILNLVGFLWPLRKWFELESSVSTT